MSKRVPKYRLHKPTGQAVVTLNGHDFYLGKYGSIASKDEYARRLKEWEANSRQVVRPTASAKSDLAVCELIAAYLRHCDVYYRKDGKPTTEPANITLAMRPLRKLYGDTPAAEFGPLALKATRQAMIEAGLCRNECNKRTAHIVRLFKWGAANELVPASVHHGMTAVAGLRMGRSEARESEPVKPVPEAFVDAVRPHVAPQIWAMIELQRLTGARPGEVVIMRTMDIDMAGRVWVYTPSRHKTEHHGKERQIYLGPQAQAVLWPWLRPELAAYLFSPKEVLEAHYKARREGRKTPHTPSSRARQRATRRERAPQDHYTTQSYDRAIAVACKRAFPHPTLSGIPRKDLTPEQRAELKAWRPAESWHPHRLRHNAATWLRREFGLDVARVILGHSSPVVTEVYAEVDREKAIRVMEQVG
jgi:integrase